MNKAHTSMAMIATLLVSGGAYAANMKGQPTVDGYRHIYTVNAPYHSHAPHGATHQHVYHHYDHRGHRGQRGKRTPYYHEVRTSFHEPYHYHVQPRYEVGKGMTYHVPGAEKTVAQRQVSSGLREVRTSFHVPHSQLHPVETHIYHHNSALPHSHHSTPNK